VIYGAAKSTIHEILAAVMFSMGVLALGQGAIIRNARDEIRHLERSGGPML
jgi:hypothetical protein